MSNIVLFMEPSLFVIVPGFGRPHIEEKIRILQNNIERIKTYPWSKLVIKVCIYDQEAPNYIPSELLNNNSIQWISEKGIVAQYIHRHATPDETNAFDYVMFLLDDIELTESVRFNQMINYGRMFNFDIISPVLSLDSKYQFEYMLTKPNSTVDIMVTSACEAFCYFMPSSSYAKYYTHLEPERNPWMWGMDMGIYKCIGMKTGLMNKMIMIHHYKNECYFMHPDINPCDGYNIVLEKYGVSSEELADQKAVLYYILDSEFLS